MLWSVLPVNIAFLWLGNPFNSEVRYLPLGFTQFYVSVVPNFDTTKKNFHIDKINNLYFLSAIGGSVCHIYFVWSKVWILIFFPP